MRRMIRLIGLLGICSIAGSLWAASVSADGGTSDAGSSGFKARSNGEIAADLGVLQGEGSGVTAAYLAKPTQRIQAAIMDLRLKGLEAAALAFTGKETFSDAALAGAQNQPVLAYLKAHPELGWGGVGDNRFDPLSGITSQQFDKVLLESLGYKSGTDYAYSDTEAFAKAVGLTEAAGIGNLDNRDIANAVVEALDISPKGAAGFLTLAQALQDKGALKKGVSAPSSYTKLKLAWNAKLGRILVDAQGRTLYYFTKDVANPNACQTQCLQAWPIYDAAALQVPAGMEASDFGRFQRSDGTMQATYKGWPLYYFAGDKAPGDTNGENVGKVWFVLKAPEYSVMLGTNAGLGNYLTDNRGHTLYYFDKDTPGLSNCSGNCLKVWPAFHADSDAVPTGLAPSDFGVITRADGTMQTTYQGYPLYYYAGDKAAGDTTGQGVNQIWFVVKPGDFHGTTAAAQTAP